MPSIDFRNTFKSIIEWWFGGGGGVALGTQRYGDKIRTFSLFTFSKRKQTKQG